MATKSVKQIIDFCHELFTDLEFTRARQWKDAEPGRKVIGYMPVYVPREIIHAAGMLPLGILGGGADMEVIHGDAYYQSYICRIPRSTIDLAITGKLDFVDGMLFPSICDVIRNLTGIWQLMFKEKYVRYFDTPQNFRDEIGGTFYAHELGELRADLEELGGRKISDEQLNRSIAIYNENREWVNRVYDYRAATPWKAPAFEVYLLMRAGMVLPPEEHSTLLRDYLAAAELEDRPLRDNCRVVMTGSFCEQPPLNLIKSIELAGCYIVDDDFMLVNRWLLQEVPTDGDPLANLCRAFLHHSAETAAKYEADMEKKGSYLLGLIEKRNAEGVIFAAPSFCDPALLDQPMIVRRVAERNIPYITLQYAENSGQMQPIREQAGTFADSIKLWSAS
ncbi:benzoyl-CoA reductase subunit C [Geothermobacter hydrogeniphilus]|uniref:Benzoyl-CoA reductase subunit C n=1 Tax=Geothermobacter hydrogeniphilus TaxID=1969733 RepID=A0A1X0Y246_9BACT|nr:benzoyl-CoA reductase subunit C [Geothermobacter hydrogeniphilus]ORJ59281.1 benzoyl-CoA reductase subunit C [Geothermobacter hydrogeniphilus]